MLIQDNRPEMNRYLRTQELNLNRYDTSYVKSWILGVLKMRKLVREAIENEMPQFFALI